MAIVVNFNGAAIRKPGLYGLPSTWIDKQSDETIFFLKLLAITGNNEALKTCQNSWYKTRLGIGFHMLNAKLKEVYNEIK